MYVIFEKKNVKNNVIKLKNIFLKKKLPVVVVSNEVKKLCVVG